MLPYAHLPSIVTLGSWAAPPVPALQTTTSTRPKPSCAASVMSSAKWAPWDMENVGKYGKFPRKIWIFIGKLWKTTILHVKN